MLLLIFVLLLLLWFLGYGPVEALNVPLFSINRQTIYLWDLLIFSVVLWLIGALPSPFREIAGVLLILWLLSLFGIIAVAGLSNMIVLALLVGLLVYIAKVSLL